MERQWARWSSNRGLGAGSNIPGRWSVRLSVFNQRSWGSRLDQSPSGQMRNQGEVQWCLYVIGASPIGDPQLWRIRWIPDLRSQNEELVWRIDWCFVYFGSLILASLFILQTRHYRFHIPVSLRKRERGGLPWWRSGWESACQCRGHGFEPWSGKIPHAVEQLGPWATINWACASGACASQQERPRQREARAPRWRVAPTCCN